MDIEAFLLCDAATHAGGKLNVLGAFDALHVHRFPGVHPHCAVALRIRFDRIEEGEHGVKINMIDEDGQAILPPLEGKVKVVFPQKIRSVCTNVVLNIHQLKFEKAGSYAIDLAIDGRHERSIPLNVFSVPQGGRAEA